jgi:hypothetical protein
MPIGGGTINGVNASFNPVSMLINADGSCSITVQVILNGALRVRQVGISADGLTFTLDGQPLTPWAALSTLGAAQPGTKVDAVFAAAGALSPMTAP